MLTPRGRLALLLAVALAHGLLIVLLPGSTPRVRPVQAELQLDLLAHTAHSSSSRANRNNPAAQADRNPVPPAQVAPVPAAHPALPAETARPVDAVLPAATPVPAHPAALTESNSTTGATRPLPAGLPAAQNVPQRRAPQCPDAARPPVYPAAAQRFNQEGKVVLQALVAADGRVAEVKLKQGSGFALLDSAAQEQARRWRCQSAQENGVAVAGWVQVTMVFDLE